jgi:glycosyltransferase involved in cell wall biosynthesis
MEAAAPPRLSVIVPVFNGRLTLPRCLEALRCSTYADFEVIVADDCSTDNTPQIVERSGARYVRTPHTMGPGGARNLGVRHALGEIVVFVDADVVLPPEALGLIAADFQRDPELAALFGSYDEAPAWSDFLSQYKNLMHHYVHQISSRRAVTFWAGCGAVRRSVFLEFGGFNTAKYPNPSIEDIELGYRLTAARRRILLEKRLQVKHLKKWTLRGLLRADILYRAVPWANLILETSNLPRDLNLTYSAMFSAALVGLLVLNALLLPFSAADALASGATWLTPTMLLAAMLVIVVLLLALNGHLYAWFAQRRGFWFAAGAVLAHWAYYFYSGVVFVSCWLRHFLRAPFRSRRKPLAAPPEISE